MKKNTRSIIKLKYKHVRFKKSQQKTENSVYYCINNKQNSKAGLIIYFPAYNSYHLVPYMQTIYNAAQLKEIQDFINQLNNY